MNIEAKELVVETATEYDWRQIILDNANVFGFLQSGAWAETIAHLGRRVEKLFIKDYDTVVAFALIDYRSIGFGKQYAFCPKGPVMSGKWKDQSGKPVIDALCEYLKNKNCIFLRIEPNHSFHFPLSSFHSTLVHDINPPTTLLLDLTPTPDQLLAAQHPKTRYNIRLAAKRGVRIEVKKSLEILWNLLQKTGARDNFGIHPKKTYEEVLKLPNVEQLVAYINDTPVATGCFIRFGKVVSYLYGASDHAYRESMAPHLVQWTAILRSKEAGAKTYDFFGISPSKKPIANSSKPIGHEYDPKHRYAGVTRFKLGFGGTVREDPGTFDIILSPVSYFFFSLFRYFRSLFK